MEYHKIVSVTGLGGLYELLSSKSDGAVVRSLEDKSTKFVSSRKHNFSHLESIEVFTVKDNTNLADLFIAMKENAEKVPESTADNKTLKAYFDKVYPDMDFERVYASDMKKMVRWFHILKQNDIEIKQASPEEVEEGAETAKPSKPSHKEKPVVKDMKPQKTTTRKIESRGVK
ncbi:MAG: DUF5606 domain-containing protein [Ginsengibacter sp.]